MALRPSGEGADLLRAVDAGNVIGTLTYGVGLRTGHAYRLVTDDVRELHAAGWVRPIANSISQTWELTRLGRAALAAVSDPTALAALIAAEHFRLSPGDVRGTR